jgi:hypothetical protein
MMRWRGLGDEALKILGTELGAGALVSAGAAIPADGGGTDGTASFAGRNSPGSRTPAGQRKSNDRGE